MDPTANDAMFGSPIVTLAIQLVHVLLALRVTPCQATLVFAILGVASTLMQTAIAKVAKQIAQIVIVTTLAMVFRQVIVNRIHANPHILKLIEC
jgi:hypothetical protein